jgi:hypothetical protein
MNLMMKGQKHVELKGDLDTVRNMIREGMNCKQTLPSTPAACSTAGYIPLKKNDGSDLIPANGVAGVTVGDWKVRVSCTSTEIKIERARYATLGTFSRDPLTNREQDWQPMFGPGELCSNYFGGTFNGALFGGSIMRCPFDRTSATPDVAVWGVSSPRYPSYTNEFTGTNDCPPGYNAHFVHGFMNYGCASNFYNGCAWKISNPAINWSATDPDALDSTKWHGCGMTVYTCSKAL